MKYDTEKLNSYILNNYSAGTDDSSALHSTLEMYCSGARSFSAEELEPGFSETVIGLAEKKYRHLSGFCKKANLSKQVISKMKTEPEYLPTKRNAFACIVALEVAPPEADELLRKGSYAFSKSNLTDVIVRFFLENKVFDIYTINQALTDYGQQILGSIA